MIARPLSRPGLPARVFVFVGALLVAPPASSQPTPSPDDAVRSGLEMLAIRPGDLHLNISNIPRDPYRLSIVDSLLAHPLRACETLDGIASRRSAPGAGLVDDWEEYATLLLSRPPAWGEVRYEPALLEPLVEEFGYQLGRVVQMLYLVERARVRALAGLSPADVVYLKARSHELLGQEDDDRDLGVIEYRRREKRNAAFRDSVFALCERVDLRSVVAMGNQLFRIAGVEGSPAHDVLRGWDETGRDETEPPDVLRGRVEGPIRFAVETDIGWIVVGGSGDNEYRGAFAAIIDPRGDDLYDLARESDGAECAVSAVIDLAGDDRYRGRGPGTLGGGFLGAGLLYDASGDDIYEADPISMGAGWIGVGALWDREGKDRYLGSAATEGIGFLGIGILRDDAGEDLYQASLYAQGFGFVGGVGVIEDAGGNDHYLIQPEEVSVLHYNDHTYSMAQGASFGERPDYSGGVGLILDGGGNDSYIADLFAQGVSYWLGLGGLWDRDGHDHYAAHQYAQGSGVHLAVGLLLDDAGNDTYQSKGVSQGVGHDLALGVLRDLQGNDTYAAHDLSQGAGNANGIGLLIDAAGIDGYLTKSDSNVLGYGNYRRQYESVGLAIDLLGQDFRAPRGRDAGAWFAGTVGAGIDWPGEITAEAANTDTFKLPVRDAVYTHEELFLMARSGEPRFSLWRAMGTDSLVARGVSAVPFLKTQLGTDVARERHTLKDLFKAMGQTALVLLFDDVDGRTERERSLILWIAGESREPALAPLLLPFLDDHSPQVRAGAMDALGKVWPDEPQPELTRTVSARAITALAEDEEQVAKAAAFLLGGLRRSDGVGPLLAGLASRSPMVRTASRLALGGYEAELPAALASHPVPSDPLARANLLLLAAEYPGERWGDRLGAMVLDLDLTDEAVAAAAARLVVAWRSHEELSDDHRAIIRRLEATLLDTSALPPQLILQR